MSSNNRKWYKWLKQATLRKNAMMKHVYSDGRQLVAVRNDSMHVRQVALGEQGGVTLSLNALFVVEPHEKRLPPFAAALPAGEPAAVIIVERTRLLQALAGQDEVVRLSLYDEGIGARAELSSAGAYALVLATDKGKDVAFWRPDFDKLYFPLTILT
jgi:hypothetical protein